MKPGPGIHRAQLASHDLAVSLGLADISTHVPKLELLAAAAGLKNLEIIKREKLCENAREVGAYFQQRIKSLYDIPIVRDVRGLGLMACVECELTRGADDLEMDYEIGDRIDQHCQAMGLIVRPLANMCVLSPPLIITKAQVDDLVDILYKGVALAMQDCIADGTFKSL